MKATDAGRAWPFAGLATLWLGMSGAGLLYLTHYAGVPGDSGGPPPAWPADSLLPGPKVRPMLVMLAHPRCACTRASLEELARLVTRTSGRLDVRVAFFVPTGASEEWRTGAVWSMAAAIPGVETFADPDGVEARRFGARTSGHTLLYDAKGRLLFSGGITVSRGHAGDNAGVDAIETLLGRRQLGLRETPVFGCALQDATDRLVPEPR